MDNSTQEPLANNGEQQAENNTSPTPNIGDKGTKFKWIGVGVLAILVVVGIVTAIWFGFLKNYDNQNSNQVNNPAPTKEKLKSEPEVATIPNGWVEYKNTEFGFAFVYPQKYGKVKIGQTYGTEGEYGRLISFAFTTLCVTCEPGQTDTRASGLASPGRIEMGAVAPDFGGVGTSKPIAGIPWGAGYTKNPNGTLSPNYWRSQNPKKEFNYPAFKGENIEGLLIQYEDDFHNLFRTSVVFNLRHKEIQGFEFMTHDKIGESKNAENLKSVARSFRLLD